jgi:hypothetical protein
MKDDELESKKTDVSKFILRARANSKNALKPETALKLV